MPCFIKVHPRLWVALPSQLGPFRQINRAVMVFDRIADLDHLGQHHRVIVARPQGLFRITIAGMIILALKPIDRQILLPVMLERCTPAKLLLIRVPVTGQLRQHRGHIPPDQGVPKVIDPQSALRRGQRRGIGGLHNFWVRFRWPEPIAQKRHRRQNRQRYQQKPASPSRHAKTPHSPCL